MGFLQDLLRQHETLRPRHDSMVADLAERQPLERRAIVEVQRLTDEAARSATVQDAGLQGEDALRAVVEDLVAGGPRHAADEVALDRRRGGRRS